MSANVNVIVYIPALRAFTLCEWMSAPRRKHKHGLEWHEPCKREQCFLSIRVIHVTRIETKLLQKEAFATMCNYTNVMI